MEWDERAAWRVAIEASTMLRVDISRDWGSSESQSSVNQIAPSVIRREGTEISVLSPAQLSGLTATKQTKTLSKFRSRKFQAAAS